MKVTRVITGIWDVVFDGKNPEQKGYHGHCASVEIAKQSFVLLYSFA